ncbi:hypothetical protein H4R99_003990 [Coemansia sp. RSA 1722]|nr:hypothetical protein IWW45_003335 [Coemansia sp. RSA 485]KAJ2596974.1 hypothetical protein GGF39_003240 [Coemansia sp. RSA 1721]KAJ2598731.1 hypothetical protein H4R99_003990 [Coemansia sp. RSA 1722]KAJ2634452.1 hypothetical protein GGF40_004195 [Coemansia sp. RSA 1286]
MSTYIIYVPGHVDRSKIQSCALDICSTFVDIDLETFDVSAKLEEHKYFIVLDKDYFLVYQKQHPEGVKCNYQQRNLFMEQMRYSDVLSKWNDIPSKESNGIWSYERLSVLYFVFRPKADPSKLSGYSYYNTIAEFYDTAEGEDFEKFAEIARTKDSCVSHFFVISRETTFYVVDTSNPGINYKFSTALGNKIIRNLTFKLATIQDFIEEEKTLHKLRPTTKRDPNFQLRDNQGVPLQENETFELEMYNSRYEDSLKEENRDRGDFDHVEVADNVHRVYIFGSADHGAVFGFKVVDGITYLTHNNNYICASSGETHIETILSPELPPKERRIQIHYAEDGNLLLSKWNGDSYYYCDWIKVSYGEFISDYPEFTLRWGEPVKLIIKRV